MASSNKRVVFAAVSKELATLFWRPETERLAKELGFDVVVPILHTDTERVDDWGPWLAGADAVMTTWSSPRCTAEFLKPGPNVKIVAHAAGSVAGVVDASTYAAGVAVTTANPTMAETVAEWSLMATLMALRNLSVYAKFGAGRPMRWLGRDVLLDPDDATVGIWGFGDITRHLLRMLAVLPLKRVLVHSTHATDADLAARGARRADLDELLATSDIVHCLAGQTPENLGRVGARELALLKDGAWLVNAGRARLIQEAPLMDTLKSGRIKGVFDVYYQEPLPEDHPLQSLDNVILTPHNAGSAVSRYVPYALRELRRFFDGKPLEAGITEARYRTMTNEALR